MEKLINKSLVITLIAGVLFGGIAFLLRNVPHASEAGGSFTFPQLDYLDIDLQRLDADIFLYDGDEITVEYKNDRPLSMELGDNELIITESTDFAVSVFAGKRSEFGLKIYLPVTVYRDVSIYSAAGSIGVHGIDCQKLTAVTESGDIIVENMGYTASMITTYGNIYADMGFVAPNTDILNRNGDIELTFPSESSVGIDFSTKDGTCSSELINGQVFGDYLYSFNGGKTKISVAAEHGTLVIKERNRT